MAVCRQNVVAIALTLFVASCGGGEGNSSDSAPPAQPSAPKVTTTRLSSAYTGQTYTISILVPSANVGPDIAPAPVIYSMDAEDLFLAQSGALAAMPQAASRSILVGISAISIATGHTDYQMPGAAQYFKFLTLELIPFIDSNYRTDPSIRILSGWSSLGGPMVYYAMLLDTPNKRHFTYFMAADPSFSIGGTDVYPLEQQMYESSHDLPVTLLIAADVSFNHNLAFCNQLASRGYTNFDLKFGTYGQDRLGMDLPSFVDQLSYIFKLGPPTAGTIGACGF